MGASREDEQEELDGDTRTTPAPVTATPTSCLRRIRFVCAQRADDGWAATGIEWQSLVHLTEAPKSTAHQAGAMATEGRLSRSGGGHPPLGVSQPELFPAEGVSLSWTEMRKAGAGLQNLGNTCFMNSVLQSLVHTPPLAELLLSGGSGCLHNGAVNGCYPIALAQELVSCSLARTTRSPLSPLNFAMALRRISRSFRLGRQEDAHEFLIALLDAMHEASIAGMSPKPPPELAHTSFIYRIFGGRMRSQVKCSECGYESNTYDPCTDLSLEITRATSVKRALEHFTKGEVLDGGNKYRCPREQKPVRAVKRMTVDVAPNVLMIQLKRFEFSSSGHKISKKIDFDLQLDLGPYMSRTPVVPTLYDLYAVLVHSGHSVHSGHYYAYVRAPNGIWHICDDTHVAQVAERQVMAQKAYILFYLKQDPGSTLVARVSPPAAAPPPPAPATAPAPAPLGQHAARLQDVQQPGRQDCQQHARAAALSSKKRRHLEPAVDSDHPPQRHRHVGKKQRRMFWKQAAAGDNDTATGSFARRLRSRTAPTPMFVTAALAVTRRGARLAEAISITQHPMPHARRLRRRQKGRQKGRAMPAAASSGDNAPPAVRRHPSPGSSGPDAASSATPVVSAPDWPPVKQPGLVAIAAATGNRPAQQQHSQLSKEHHGTLEGCTTRPVARQADVHAFLRAGAGQRVRAWDVAEWVDKDLQRRLLRKEAPDKRRRANYDAEYDQGRTKKVRAKLACEGSNDHGPSFDEAQRNKQRRGVPTELRGNRKRRAFTT